MAFPEKLIVCIIAVIIPVFILQEGLNVSEAQNFKIIELAVYLPEELFCAQAGQHGFERCKPGVEQISVLPAEEV